MTSAPVAITRSMAAAGQDHHAVRVHEAVAALGELAGQEAVAGLEAGQAGEVGEARVGGHDEDEHRAGLQRVEEHVAERRRCRRRPRRPGRSRSACRPRTARPGSAAASTDRPRNMTPSPMPMMHQRLAGVAPRRLLERRDAVGDGLDAGDRGAAGGERVQHDEQRRAHRGGPSPALAVLDVALDGVADDRAGRRRRASRARCRAARPC